MVFADIGECESNREGGKKGGQLRGIVQFILFVVDVTEAELIFLRHIVVDALNVVGPALPCRGNDRHVAYFNVTGGTRAVGGSAERADFRNSVVCYTPVWRSRHRDILLEDRKVVLAKAWVSCYRRQSCGGRRGDRPTTDRNVADGVAFKVGKEEQFVLDNWATEGSAETVIVEPGIAGQALLHPSFVDGVEIAVSEVFVN